MLKGKLLTSLTRKSLFTFAPMTLLWTSTGVLQLATFCDFCKLAETDGLARRPQSTPEGWEVWCFCGKKMDLFATDGRSRLELRYTCPACGEFAQTGFRFLSAGDAVWHCTSCASSEQAKKGTKEPLGIPGAPELRALREQGHVLLECARLSLGKDAAYRAVGKDFHFGQSGMSATINAIRALREILPAQSDAGLSASAQKRRLLRLQDDDISGCALTTALSEGMCQDVKDSLLFGYANAGHARLVTLLLQAR